MSVRNDDKWNDEAIRTQDWTCVPKLSNIKFTLIFSRVIFNV